jgi:pimeloyl-ACP methyl ester carboxylesterase
VTSKDGTTIAYDREGSGPAVILVGGGLVSRKEGIGNNAPLVPELAEHFTVYNYDRRGRGDSGDTAPYGVEREIEDLSALIDAAGGSAHLYGVSAGGALALEAAAAGIGVDRLSVFEVPYCVTEETQRRSQEFVERLGPALESGRPGDALELFMWFAGSSEDDIAGARNSPFWPGLEAVEHTIGYDVACMAGYRVPADRLAKITQPTLVATGGAGLDSHSAGLPADFFERAAEAIVASVPDAEHRTVEGQSHAVEPKAIAPMLEEFFNG